MIRLATVFSGIGAIEHALERMGLDYSIELACDNGDVDILSKEVEESFETIEQEIFELEGIILKIENMKDNDIEYTDRLKNELEKIREKERKVKSNLEVESNLLEVTKYILDRFVDKEFLNKSTYKVHKNWHDELENKAVIDNEDMILTLFRINEKLIRDYKRLGGINFHDSELFKDVETQYQYSSTVNINYIKKTLKTVREIAKKLSMLHERINTFYISKELSKIDNFAEKKAYVDKLYNSRKSSNKVMESYLANYTIAEKDFHWNASFLDGNEYKNKIDLFVGGSPCQSFSAVGKQRGMNDTRGTLFFEYARLLNEIQPKVFIYENVRSILSNDDGKTWARMTEIFEESGYNWSYEVLNSRDFGIPQNRERVFVVGFRKDLGEIDFNFPEPIKLDKTMQDFLIDNVSGKYYLSKKGVKFVTSEKNISKRYTQINGEVQLCQKKNQQFNWHGDFVFVEENEDLQKTMKDLDKYFLSEKVKKYVLSSGTKGFYSKPEIDLKIARPLLTSMHKMHRAGVDNYVTTEGRLRKLTPRECLRLMGFCDSFEIKVSDTSMYQQAGNSIVVDVLIALVEEITKAYPKIGGERLNGK